MSMATSFGRVITAMVTPFNKDFSVNYAEAARLAEWLVNNGSDGLVVTGTTGESPTLTRDEKLNLFRTVVEAVGGKAAVIAGTGSNSHEASVELTRAAEKTGVDGILLVTPYYNKPTQEGLYQHFTKIAEATSLPVMLYNVPGRTGCNMLPETVQRLSEVPNIVAVKEASGDLAQITRIISLVPEDFLVYSGDDAMTLPVMAIGGCGIVSVASHLVGSRMKEMVDAHLAGRVELAGRIHRELSPLFKALFAVTSPIPVKAALNMTGHNVGGLRLPLVEATETEREQLRGSLKKLGLL